MKRQHNYFYLAAAIIIDTNNRLLLVRKHNTQKFMLPGGKIEIGESAIDALLRELKEEISLQIAENDAVYINSYEADAANEPNYKIHSQVFKINLTESHTLSPQAEIDEVIWIEPNTIPELAYAPLVIEHIFPLWKQIIQSN